MCAVLAAACPSHCLQCTVNSVSGAVECDADRCMSGYGLKDSDKSCVGKRLHSTVYHAKVLTFAVVQLK